MAGKNRPHKPDPAEEAFLLGLRRVEAHPLFGVLLDGAHVTRAKDGYCPDGGWAVVIDRGEIQVHPSRRGAPEEWAWVIAHALLHLAFEHFKPRPNPAAWNAACCAVVSRFLAGMKFGRPPAEIAAGDTSRASAEEVLYREFDADGVPDEHKGGSLAGETVDDLWFSHGRGDCSPRRTTKSWSALFAEGLRRAVDGAVRAAAGLDPKAPDASTPGRRARDWFIDHYPLLGALAVAFDIIEDPTLLHRMDISVGAVDPARREIYLNSAKLDERERRFVMAHELLHVGLRHDARRQGRDPFLWNVACDYVINAWLLEMGIGDMPPVGGLHDPELKGLSAEAIYDRIVTDLRRYRKLATLRGAGLADILGPPDWEATPDFQRLDDFYRRCLAQGLMLHDEECRGFLPAGLIEEIRALSHPPIPWDVELARWFDDHFAPLDRRRSYARQSRRQSATPDIPRPRLVVADGAVEGRTFAVVLDTSGSMSPELLARALGATASYAVARDVPLVRVVFCDAAVYDQGFMPPEAIAGRVKVRGRGGTVLQPAIDLVQSAPDFPKSGPILVITDGACDRLSIGREHAYLLPAGRHLPFVARGPIFRMK